MFMDDSEIKKPAPVSSNISDNQEQSDNHYPEEDNSIIGIEQSASSNNNNIPENVDNNKHPVPINVDAIVLENNDNDKILVTVDIENTITEYQEDSTDHCEESDDNNESSTTLSSINSDDDDDDDDDNDDDEQRTCDQFNKQNVIAHRVSQPGQIQQVLNSIAIPVDGGLNIGESLTVTKSSGIHVGTSNKTNYQAPVTIIYSNKTTLANDSKNEIQYKQYNGNTNNDEHNTNSNGNIQKNNKNENELVADKRKLSKTSSRSILPFSNNKAIIKCFCTGQCIISICVVVVILLAFIILTLWLTGVIKPEPTPSTPSNQQNDSSNGDYLKTVKREEWGGKDPRSLPKKLKQLPPAYVIITDTVTPFCYNKTVCSTSVRYMQNLNMDKMGYNDIAYNFLIGGDGNIYEGRGWDIEGDHTKGYDFQSICIAFIGEFRISKTKPRKAQLGAADTLLKYGLRNEKFTYDYKLLGQRQVMNVTGPGEILYGIIQQHDHWSPTP